MCSEELLVCRIFEQAIDDYKTLTEKNITMDKDSSGFYSIKEIEKFFKGNWCGLLLGMINSELTGRDVLSRIEVQCA